MVNSKGVVALYEGATLPMTFGFECERTNLKCFRLLCTHWATVRRASAENNILGWLE